MRAAARLQLIAVDEYDLAILAGRLQHLADSLARCANGAQAEAGVCFSELKDRWPVSSSAIPGVTRCSSPAIGAIANSNAQNKTTDFLKITTVP